MAVRWTKIFMTLAVILFISACAKPSPLPMSSPIIKPAAPSVLPSPTFEPSAVDAIEWIKEHSINLRDNGKVFTYAVTSRFMIFLDETDYPLNELTCEPKWIMGYISNGSLRGPDNYPIMFEAVEEGTCILNDRDFQIRIVVANP